MMTGIANDIRSGLRALRARSASTALAVMMLAFGIAGATSMFSVVHAVLLRPLPFAHPDSLVAVYATTRQDPTENWSGPDYLDLREKATLLAGIAGSRGQRYALRTTAEAAEVRGESVTDNFFEVLGVRPLLGSVITPRVGGETPAREVVLGYDLWQSRFGGSPRVVGSSIVLNEEPYTVIGVMPRGFAHPPAAALWTRSRWRVPEPPFDFGANPEQLRQAHYFDIVARLKPGVSRQQASAQAVAVMADLARQYPDSNADRSVRVVGMLESLVGDVQTTMWLLLGAVVCVLLIACANVAGLLMVRAAERDREVVIRIAVGASRQHLVRQALAESLVLAMASGLMAVLASLWLTDGVVALVPVDVPRLREVGLSWPVLIFAFGAAVLAGLLTSLGPALRWMSRDVSATLIRGGERVSMSRTRHLLIVGEVAASAILLVGAILMMRSLTLLGRVDPGFRPESVVAGRVSLPEQLYADNDQLRRFADQVVEHVRRTPGISSTGIVMSLPIDSTMSADLRFHIDGRPEPTEPRRAGYQTVSSGYFETMGIPLMAGRLFTEQDRNGGTFVALVSEAFAREYFGSQSPLGERLTWGNPQARDVRWATIVGVVGSTRHSGIQTAPRAEAYVPYDQSPTPFLWVTARGTLGDDRTIAAVRKAVQAVDPGRPVTRLRPLTQVLRSSLGEPRFGTVMLTAFASMAILLASLGLYGVLAYSVARRSRDLGIRMALGARRSRLLCGTLWEGLRLAAAGVVIGLASALSLSRVVASRLHDVKPSDPISLALCLLVLALVSLLASLVPALRATRIDPATTLRAE